MISPRSSLYQAYYGPPIPTQQPYPRQRSCLFCFFSTFMKAFVIFCVALGITVLILWLIFRPTTIKVAVETASLASFNLTTNPFPILSYNLTTDISLRNPNKHIGIYYDWLEADAYYSGVRFGWTGLQTFYQGHNNTIMVHPVFLGQSAVGLGDSDVQEFRKQNTTGVFDVDVWLNGRVRYKIGAIVTRRYTMKVTCRLSLSLATNGTSSAGFKRTDCHVLN